jgi:hypothetical protein
VILASAIAASRLTALLSATIVVLGLVVTTVVGGVEIF